jgi:CRP-like cAMP-binding protein
MLQAWIDLATLEGPDYFGEAAILTRGFRHATALADSKVELLALTKVDFDLRIDQDAREVVGILVSNYPKDNDILKCDCQR